MRIKALLSWFHPTIDAFLVKDVPFHYRWRLLLFQPFAILTYLISTLPVLFSHRSSVLEIPVRDGRKIRSLLYLPPQSTSASSRTLTSPQAKSSITSASKTSTQPRLRPLHLDIHGGAFLGGLPDGNHRFCTALSDRTGAVVVSATYRFAPRHPFPAAVEDIDDIVAWLRENAEAELQADPACLTLSGSSAGGNLALATSLTADGSDTGKESKVKAVVTFYAPIDVSTPPAQKPRPPEFPSRDPLWFLLPLYDAYGASARPDHANDPRSSPYYARAEQLPRKILMIVPTIDILVAEQLNFAERVNQECKSKGEDEKVELMIMEKCFHGWLELPSAVIDETTRTKAFDRGIEFLKKAYDEHGRC